MRKKVRAALLSASETVAVRKRQESELEVDEDMRVDRIRKEFIRGAAQVGCFADKVREDII